MIVTPLMATPSWADVQFFQPTLPKFCRTQRSPHHGLRHNYVPLSVSLAGVHFCTTLPLSWSFTHSLSMAPREVLSTSEAGPLLPPCFRRFNTGEGKVMGGSQQRKASKTHAPELGVTAQRYKVQPQSYGGCKSTKSFKKFSLPSTWVGLSSVSSPAPRWAVSPRRRNRARWRVRFDVP